MDVGLDFDFGFLLDLGFVGLARIFSMNPGVISDSVDEDDNYDDDGDDDESSDTRLISVVWFGNTMDKGFVMSRAELEGGRD
jgi:hypothetical protein